MVALFLIAGGSFFFYEWPMADAVYDTGEDVLGEGPTSETVPFIVMELLRGRPLDARLAG